MPVTPSKSETCIIVTIDGPSGAGKGTICRLLAQQLGFALLDSGALYRLTALAAMIQGIDLQDESAVAEVARNLDVEFQVVGEDTQILLGGQNVTQQIRSEAVSANASVAAAYPAVRTALFDRQRAFAQPPGLVADGRDMGTVVFPEAPVKIFLTASAEERAQRRYLQLQEAGQEADYPTILAAIQARDERDSGRATAPLVPAQDAHILDSTHLSIEEVLAQVQTRVAAL